MASADMKWLAVNMGIIDHGDNHQPWTKQVIGDAKSYQLAGTWVVDEQMWCILP